MDQNVFWMRKSGSQISTASTSSCGKFRLKWENRRKSWKIDGDRFDDVKMLLYAVIGNYMVIIDQKSFV